MYKAYFIGSAQPSREDSPFYQGIMDQLGKHGEVLSNQLSGRIVSFVGGRLAEKRRHVQELARLSECDVVVAEVTHADADTGYMLGRAAERNALLPSRSKRLILCLYRQGEDGSPVGMLAGSEDLEAVRYSDMDDIRTITDGLFAKLDNMRRGRMRSR